MYTGGTFDLYPWLPWHVIILVTPVYNVGTVPPQLQALHAPTQKTVVLHVDGNTYTN